MLEDVQNRPDDRHLAIDEVGIAGIRHPVSVQDREHGKQETVADFRLSVDLRAEVKGAHLSRFVEILQDHGCEVTLQSLPGMLHALRERLGTQTARIEVRFPFFLRRPAPVTASAGLLDYECVLSGCARDGETTVTLTVTTPVTSVCPCSKAISDYGAHNQRGRITIEAQIRSESDGQPASVWIEELIGIAESAASAPVFPLLKRPDERHVTMQAHDNPVFVEDMVRAAATALQRDSRISGFRVEAVNDESIHNHAAFARINLLAHRPATEGG